MAWFVSRRNCPSFLTANTVAGPLDNAHRPGRTGGNHQDPPATLLLPGRTHHPQGAPSHPAPAPRLALAKPVQPRSRQTTRPAAPFLIAPTVSDCPRACPTPARLTPACLLLQSGCRSRLPPALRAVRNRLRGADTLSTRPNPSGSKTCRLYPSLFMPRLTSPTTSFRWIRAWGLVKPCSSSFCRNSASGI